MKPCICLACKHQGKPKQKSKAIDYCLSIFLCCVLPPLGLIALFATMFKKSHLLCAKCGSTSVVFVAQKGSSLKAGFFIGG